MRILKDVLKRRMIIIVLWAVFAVVFYAVFSLYEIIVEPLYYAYAVTLFILIVFLFIDFIRESRRAVDREYALNAIATDLSYLPEARSAAEEDYQKMIEKLGRKMEEVVTDLSSEKQDYLDYYTAWVHQIKTPIAVMKFKLAEDTPENRSLRAELFRIEQYVDMALQYIRLGSETNDLVVKEIDLDEVVRESIRRFAPQFIEKKLRLDYIPINVKLVTDKKWFMVILDQILSNAIKYTPEGTIKIYANEDALVVADSGIGIAKEDIPRVFEKGFTGNNGRLGEKSTGLGLYLAKKAADMLGLKLSAESHEGGTKLKIGWKQESFNRAD